MRCVLALALCCVVVASGFAADGPPKLQHEFRAAWVATVANIDWPSKPGLSVEDQKKELIAILDRCVELKLNATVFQIRPMCDALYESKLEPWSGFLTGTPGKNPGYDPLKYAIDESHQRGLELHAWFNPYRAWHPSAKGEVPASHLVKTRPDLAKKYGKHHWLNPTHPEVQKHSLNVILDVVKRYDLDGIHLDDYFYPYAELDTDKKEIPFPDDDTWETYTKVGGKLARDDWRRDAVNTFVKEMYTQVHKEKAWVKVGISPFGIWRPGFPKGIQGFDQYAKLYADAKLWLNEGWVDYWTPQLYWPIKQEPQSYPVLLKWWAEENTKKRHLWPGNIPSRVGTNTKNWTDTEIGEQIEATRKQTGASGNVHFSMKAMMKPDAAVSKDMASKYKDLALVPASAWLDDKPPVAPTLESTDNGLSLTVTAPKDALFVLVQFRDGDTWNAQRVGLKDNKLDWKLGTVSEVHVTSIDRAGNLSKPTVWKK